MPFDLDKFKEGLKAAGNAQTAAAMKAVDQFGEHVIGDAQQLTPVLTGALQASGTTLPAKMEGGTVRKEIGFNTDYAAAVHEKLQNAHKVGQAKFLEAAMNENSPKFAEFVGNRVKAG
jgi:hypothetical protein